MQEQLGGYAVFYNSSDSGSKVLNETMNNHFDKMNEVEEQLQDMQQQQITSQVTQEVSDLVKEEKERLIACGVTGSCPQQ